MGVRGDEHRERLLTDITVSDSDLGPIACPTDALGAGESMTCEATGTAGGGRTRTSAPPPARRRGEPVSDWTPPRTMERRPASRSEDHQRRDGLTIPVGSPVTWTYEVTNTGNATLTGVTVTDDQGVTVTCPSTVLEAHGTMTCEATGTAVEVRTRTSAPPPARRRGAAVVASDASSYYGSAPGLALTKAPIARAPRWATRSRIPTRSRTPGT